jgi:hypothetical protein
MSTTDPPSETSTKGCLLLAGALLLLFAAVMVVVSIVNRPAKEAFERDARMRQEQGALKIRYEEESKKRLFDKLKRDNEERNKIEADLSRRVFEPKK